MPEKYPRLYRIVLLSVCCLVVLPFFILAVYNHPSSDDYINQLTVNKNGLFTAWQNMLGKWSGRYVSTFLVYLLNPLQFSNPDWVIVITFIQVLLYVLFWYLISIIVDQLFGLKQGKLPAFTLLLIYGFCYLHNPVGLLYWFSGSWTYLPGLIALAAWTIIRTSDEKKLSRIRKVTFVILPFLIAGTNEINILFMTALLAIPCTASPPLNKLRIVAIVLFIGGAAFALLVPGNHVRANVCAATNPVFDISFSLRSSFSIAWFYFRDWTRSGPLFFIPVILLLLTGKNNEIFTTSVALKRIIVISSGAILIYLILPFPFFWATGLKIPPGRVKDLLFLCLTSIFIFSGTAILINRIREIRVSQVFPLILIITMFWIATYNSKYTRAILDIKEIGAYQTEYSTRIRLTKQAAENHPSDTLIVPQLIHRPSTIFYTELNKNPTHWFNRGFAGYYGIVGIKAIAVDTIR